MSCFTAKRPGASALCATPTGTSTALSASASAGRDGLRRRLPMASPRVLTKMHAFVDVVVDFTSNQKFSTLGEIKCLWK